MAKYEIKLGVKLDTKDVASQIRGIKPDNRIKIGIELNDSGIGSQIRRIRPPEHINIRARLDNRSVQTIQNQINNLRNQIQQLGNVNINLGGGRGNGGRGGGRRQVDETTQSYRELMAVLNQLNSKRVQLNGLNASSPHSSRQVQTLSLQIQQLENEYNNLLNTFNNQGIQFSAQQWNQIEEAMARTGRQIDVVQSKMADNSVVKNQTQAYKELLSISKEIGKLEINISKLREQGGKTNQIAELESQMKTLQSTYQHLATTMNTPLTGDQWSAIYTQIAKTQDELKQLDAKYADTKAKLAEDIRLDFSKFDSQIESLDAGMNKLTGDTSELKVGIESLRKSLETMKSISSDEELIAFADEYKKKLKEIENQLKKNQAIQGKDAYNQSLKDDRLLFQSKIDAWLKDNSKAAKRFGADMQRLRKEAEACDRQTLNHLTKEFKQVDAAADAAGLKMQKFSDRLRTQFSKYSSYFSAATVFMYASMGLRDMFEQVLAIDTAMTELKKVTDESDASYSKFLTNAASRASEIGTTIDGLVSSTADFARLGYSFESSQGLAEVANIYAVVGDEIDSVETATKSLISTFAAFKDEANGLSDADFAMSIVDKFNEVSNNFAISSGGIGEALQRSASSLFAANNSLDESIALITAANTVVQDPDVVGRFCRL